MDYATQWLTQELIKADFEEKSTGEVKYIKMPKKDLYRFCIKFIKVLEKGE